MITYEQTRNSWSNNVDHNIQMSSLIYSSQLIVLFEPLLFIVPDYTDCN